MSDEADLRSACQIPIIRQTLPGLIDIHSRPVPRGGL